MRNECKVAVIIPAINEEASIGKVIAAIPEWVDDILVADNGSTDRTPDIAREAGARVVTEPHRGYGSACLAAMAALDVPDIVVFLDGDFSDYPEEMPLLVDPIATGAADMVIGSRTAGTREPGALTPQALFGNWLSCTLIRWFWSVSYSDLGPFRAIRYETLQQLSMHDRDYGWTVEMQIKAARAGARIFEVPVSYRKRIGKSKVSGTVKGVVGAGAKILSTIFRAAMGLLPGDEEQKTRERLIVFTRYPEPGQTKTRLIRALGPDGAAELHRRMTQNAIARAKEVQKRRPVAVEIRYDGGNKRLMKGWLGRGLEFRKQHGDNLGERMHACFVEAFEDGVDRAVLAGTDCPDISADIFDRAFQALDRKDVVLGPASDGGYYLVGMKRAIPEIFAGITWGAADVLQQTTRVTDRLALQVGLVDLLNDVDRQDDLHVWERASGRPATEVMSPRISVIIPTYNEAAVVHAAISSARAENGVEIILVDGGSDDGTIEAAEAAGARTMVSDHGRGAQMNAGAAEATGDILLFLHADTRLPKDYARHVRAAMVHAGAVSGAFRLGIDSPKKSLRRIEWVANWRSRRMHLPYGDQAIFLRKEVFEDMGGFPEIPIMEDFELMRRLKRRGRIEIVKASVQTSPRRWLDIGVLRATLINQAVITAYFLGVPISRIAELYHGSRRNHTGAPKEV